MVVYDVQVMFFEVADFSSHFEFLTYVRVQILNRLVVFFFKGISMIFFFKSCIGHVSFCSQLERYLLGGLSLLSVSACAYQTQVPRA